MLSNDTRYVNWILRMHHEGEVHMHICTNKCDLTDDGKCDFVCMITLSYDHREHNFFVLYF